MCGIVGAIDLKGFATPNGWAPMSPFHQPFTDQEIRKRLGATSITTLLQHEILKIKERENDVLFSVKNLENSSEIEYTAKYLIGADGGSSSVRKLLKITQEDLDYNRDWVVVDAELTVPNRLDDKAIQVCDPERIGTFIPNDV